MNITAAKTPFVSTFTQVAWVVKDIAVAERFFREAMGIGNFSAAGIIRRRGQSRSTNERGH